MEKMTVTLRGVTHIFNIEPNEVKIHLALVKACETSCLKGLEFKFVRESQMEHSVDGEGKQIAAQIGSEVLV